jgi:hypothetical protein
MTNVGEPFMNRCFRSFCRVAAVALAGTGAMAGGAALADTSVVNEKFWVVDGTDDSATNANSMAVSLKGQAVGAFSELAFSYNIDGTNVVPVGVVKGSGEIQMAVPNGPFGGSFFLTGYWDCDAGYVPTMVISNLDFRLKGGKAPALVLKGKISNGVSMAAKDFQLIMLVPRPQLMEAELKYTLTATTNFCVDDIIHTNRENFELARMASNYLSPDTHENDIVRFVKVTSHTCVLNFCRTTRKSFCYALTDEDRFVITNGAPSLGGNPISLLNDGTVNTNSPTLAVKFMSPGPGSIRPQALVKASSDPTAENVSYWGNWRGVKATYRAKKKVVKVRYMLEVTPPKALSCDYSY